MGSDYDTSPRKELNITANLGPLAGGANILVPANWIIYGIYSADPDFADLRLQIQIAAAWINSLSYDDVVWAGVLGGTITLVPKITSDGVNVRFLNAGANPITDLYIVYEIV